MSDVDGRKRSTIGLIAVACVAVIGIAIAGLVILWGNTKQAEYERDAYQHSAEYARDTYGPEQNACVTLSAELQANCIAEARDKARNNERYEQDLVAQRTSAVWTFIMGSAAVVGMVLSTFGVYLVWTTFNATRDANKITREIGKAQVGAYMSEDRVFVTSKDGEFQFTHVWHNTGQSPALQCQCFVDYVIMKFDTEEKEIKSFSDYPKIDHIGYSCASGKEKYLYGTIINKEINDDLFAKNSKIIVFSAVRYENVFGDKYLVESCNVAEFPASGKPGDIGFRPYWHHNRVVRISGSGLTLNWSNR
jgi:hypothetical protein